jgi:predicted ribosomally synthesized peptide with SipW-like signal peptide
MGVSRKSMRNKIIFTLALVTSAVLLVAVAAASAQGTQTTLAALTNQEQLGKDLFFDTNLSDSAYE